MTSNYQQQLIHRVTQWQITHNAPSVQAIYANELNNKPVKAWHYTFWKTKYVRLAYNDWTVAPLNLYHVNVHEYIDIVMKTSQWYEIISTD